PMTTMPSIETVSSISRIASTAAWSALSLSPRPIQRAAPIAAASVTRTSSSARFRSGGWPTIAAGTLHPFGRLDADQVEAPCDHHRGGADGAGGEGFAPRADHPMVVVEAVEVVGDPNRVDRDRVGRTALGRLGHDRREVRQALDEVLFLALE